MAKTREQVLIDRYGFNHASYKWILPGAVILEYIGQPVMCLEFAKDEEGKWNVTDKKAVIEDICEFNPLTMTYKCYYRVEDKYIIYWIQNYLEHINKYDKNFSLDSNNVNNIEKSIEIESDIKNVEITNKEDIYNKNINEKDENKIEELKKKWNNIKSK